MSGFRLLIVGGVIISTRSLVGCEFEPQIDPLLFPTAPPKPFSGFSADDNAVESIDSPAALPASMSEGVGASEASFEFPSLLAWVSGAVVTVTAAFAGFTFLGSRSGSRPSLTTLVVIGVLLTLAILLVEVLFIVAEIIMLLSGLGETPIGIVLGLILSVLGLFLINFEVAYLAFVYRVASALPGEEVRLILWPWELWGLGDG